MAQSVPRKHTQQTCTCLKYYNFPYFEVGGGSLCVVGGQNLNCLSESPMKFNTYRAPTLVRSWHSSLLPSLLAAPWPYKKLQVNVVWGAIVVLAHYNFDGDWLPVHVQCIL